MKDKLSPLIEPGAYMPTNIIRTSLGVSDRYGCFACADIAQFCAKHAKPAWARRIRLNAGGYEYRKYGRYFGHGAPLYSVGFDIFGDEEVFEVRADSRTEAIETARHHAQARSHYRP